MNLINNKFIMKYNCDICKDTKEIEVIVMGVDTDYVECPYCSSKPKYKKFQEHYKQLKEKNEKH